MNQVRIRIDNNVRNLLDFIESAGYPAIPDGNYLSRHAITVRISGPDGLTVGWVWASWADYQTLCAHACCDTGVLASAIPDLFKLAEYLGAERIVVVPPPTGRLNRLLPTFCRRFGFTPRDNGLYKELTNG